MLHNLKPEKASVRVHSNKKFECLNRNSPLINHQQSGSFATCSGIYSIYHILCLRKDTIVTSLDYILLSRTRIIVVHYTVNIV